MPETPSSNPPESPSNNPPSPTRTRWTQVGTALVGLATILAIPSERIKGLGVILVTAVPIWLLIEKEPLKTKYWRVGSPILISIALLIGGLWVIRSPESPLGPKSNVGGNAATRPSQPSSPAISKFTIDLPGGLLPRCSQLMGSGKIKAGKELLILDRPANPNLTDGGKGANYFLDGAVTIGPDSNHWHLYDVSVGDPGAPVELVAELVDAGTGKFFDGLIYKIPNSNGKGSHIGPPGTAWVSPNLPPGQVVDKIFRLRDQTNVGCS